MFILASIDYSTCKHINLIFDTEEEPQEEVEDKNLIFLQLEGIDDWLITEETTPTLYKMYNELMLGFRKIKGISLKEFFKGDKYNEGFC